MKTIISKKWMIPTIIIALVIIGGAWVVYGGVIKQQGAQLWGTLPFPKGVVSTTPLALPSGSCKGVTTPKITVTSPNGGEVFTEGQQITINWQKCNIPTNAGLNIFLKTPDWIGGMNQTSPQVVGTLIPGNLTSATITLPKSDLTNGYLAPSSDFKILIDVLVPAAGNTFSTVAQDESNNVFTIVGSAATTCGTGWQICAFQNGIATTTTIPGGAGNHDLVIFKIPVRIHVSAAGFNGMTTRYIASNTEQVTGSFSSAKVQYSVDKGGTMMPTGATAVFSPVGVVAKSPNNNYIIPGGQFKDFILTVTYTPSVTGLYRSVLQNIPWAYIDATTIGTNATNGYINNAGNQIRFRTSYISAQ